MNKILSLIAQNIKRCTFDPIIFKTKTGLTLLFQDKIPGLSLIFLVKCCSFLMELCLIFSSFLSTDVGFGRALALFLAVQNFGSIKRRTALQNYCTEQNAIKIGNLAIITFK